MKRRERQMVVPRLIREVADQRQQDMMLLFQLLLQRRQRRFRGRHLGFLRQHVGAVGGAGLELVAHDHKLVAFRLDDLLRRLDLAAQRSLLDGGRHDVRGQRQICRFKLEALILGERGVRLDLPPLAAENVGRIGDIHRGLIQGKDLRRTGLAEFRRRELLRAYTDAFASTLGKSLPPEA